MDRIRNRPLNFWTLAACWATTLFFLGYVGYESIGDISKAYAASSAYLRDVSLRELDLHAYFSALTASGTPQ